MAKNGFLYAVLLLTIIGFVEAETGKVYVVDSVVRINSPKGFVCRVNNFSIVGAVRLNVTIKGIEPVGRELSDSAESFLEKILKEGKTIRLKNVEAGSYFRVKADVEVDGLDIGQSMIAGKLAIASKPDVQVEANTANTIGIPQSPTHVRSRPAERADTKTSAERAAMSKPGPYKTIKLTDLQNQIVDLSAWHEDMELSEALEILRTSTKPELPLVVMWRDLQVNGFVDKTSPIGLGGLRLVSVKKALQLLLLSVSQGRDELVCVPQGGIFTIATRQMGLGDEKVTRIYDTSELTAAQALGMMGGMGMGMGGMGMNGMGMGGMGTGMGIGNMGMGNGRTGGRSRNNRNRY